MKKYLLLVIILISIQKLQAQDSTAVIDTIPPYQKDSSHIPNFTYLKLDSTYATQSVIPKNKPVVIVYFSPECGHCMLTAQRFSEQMKDMKNIFFVWLTYYYPLSEIKEFEKKFSLQQFNNLAIGKLTDYNLPTFYRVKYTPFMAVYNKEHHLIQTYSQGTEADTLISLLKNN